MSDGFGYGGYRSAQPLPPNSTYQAPPPPAHPLPQQPPPPFQPPLPHTGVYGPLRSILNAAPPGQMADQQPARQTVRLDQHVRVAVAAGPGSESVVPFSLFSQMLLRMERLEKENAALLNVVMELNEVIEKERGTQLEVYEHESLATSTAVPWRQNT